MITSDNEIHLLLDSESIDCNISSLSRRARSLLKYRIVKPLVFFRTPDLANNDMLREIIPIEIVREKERIVCVKVPVGKMKATYGINKFANVYAQKFGEILFNKKILTPDEIRPIELAFIQSSLNEFSGRNLLVTENKVLLENRQWLQGRFSTPLNIFSMEEAAEMIDLSWKKDSLFYISPYLTTSKHNWYWLSFRTKVPNYHVDVSRFKSGNTLGDLFRRSILDAFSQRFCFLLMSIDEMGFKFCAPVNNDTIEDMTYHFNYFILLITGIFDSLALHTKNQYHLFEDSEKISPYKISLRSKIGKKFLQAVEQKNPALRKHIHDNVDLINAPYLLRELIAHRESLHPQHFNIDGANANFLFVTDNFSECLRRLGDDQEKGGCSKFGVYSRTFLSPFIFAKAMATLISKFCNRYLELLGYKNSILESNASDFLAFQADNLGF
ncbi:hypothetical protein JXA31_09945 [Candidatus Bathyarchaeota archaeon]|nr:hypothetical protein [Candidatus Bathyarchaeota archaeon]